VLFIDYAVYNGNVNLFNIGRFILEFPATGGVVPVFRLLTLKLIRYVTGYDYFILFCEILFMCFIIYFTIEEIVEVRFVGCGIYLRCVVQLLRSQPCAVLAAGCRLPAARVCGVNADTPRCARAR